ncbi:MAG: hypothetical protein KAH32_05805 [Chlamydiia bacterium]|nr:hypothetical protein [Chlamydiia bacterium]
MRVAIIDLDPLVHIVANRHYSGGNHDDDAAIISNVHSMVRHILKNANCSHYVMFFQGTGFKNFRMDIMPEYKAHRLKNEATTLWKPVIFQTLRDLGAFELKTIESDDALRILQIKLLEEEVDYVIVENDKDLAMLPGLHYNPYKPRLLNRFHVYSFEDSYLSRWSQVLSGDPTDMPNALCGIAGMATQKIDWDKPANEQKLGKAQKFLMNLEPKDYYIETIKLYILKYGFIEGMQRCKLTYQMTSLLDKVEDDLPETKKVYDAKFHKYTDPSKGLFKPRKNVGNIL